MKRANWLVLGLGILFAGLLSYFPAGEGKKISAQESGSAEEFPRLFPGSEQQPGAESGSAEEFPRLFPGSEQQRGAESGSIERVPRGLPIPSQNRRAESGSAEKPTPGGSRNRDSQKPSDQKAGKTPLSEAGSSQEETAGEAPVAGSPLANRIVPILVFLGGLFLVGWSLFRIGLFNPFTANLWPKRLELCLEMALRMDDFLSAFHERKFEKCQMSLDALNHLNGRRSILLSNEINAAVNRFVELAVAAKVSQDDEEFQTQLSRRYENVIEALRQGTRQEELSLDVLRSLTKAQGPHRRLLEKSEDDSSSASS